MSTTFFLTDTTDAGVETTTLTVFEKIDTVTDVVIESSSSSTSEFQ